MGAISLGIGLAEAGLLPDPIVRTGIRGLVRERLSEIREESCEESLAAKRARYATQSQGPIAVETDLANEQHYEVAPAFFEQVLGRHLQYSGGFWEGAESDLDSSESAMLRLSCERAEMQDGMRVLDLGCGWGSLSLWLAEHYPAAEVVSVSNSKPQREFILRRCEERGIQNVEVRTADVNVFDPESKFDRVLSVEMFEHVQNHPLLLSRIARWLAPDGKLFVHHFSHRETTYPFEVNGPNDWMGRYFFSGGIMPSDDLLLNCQSDLLVEQHWRVSGTHYQKTSEAWLARQDQRREVILPILAEAYGQDQAKQWFHRWRLFFLACAELFGYRGGEEWFVTHALMSPRRDHSPQGKA